MPETGAPTQPIEAQVPPPANTTETTPPPAQSQPEAAQPQPPQPEAVQPQEKTETEKRAEILKGRQEDISKIANILLKRKQQEGQKTLSGKSIEQQKAAYYTDETLAGLRTIDYISTLQENRTETTDEDGDPIPLVSAEDMQDTEIKFTHINNATGQSEEVVITSILTVDKNGMFICTASIDGGPPQPFTEPVPRDTMNAAVINSELPGIIDNCTDEEKQLLQVYLEQSNGNTDILLEADTRQIMEDMAKQLGMLRIDDMNAFVDSGLARPNITTQEAEDLHLLRSALSADRVLVTPDILKVAFSHMGLGQEGYLQMQMQAKLNNEQLVAQLSHLDQNSSYPEVQERIAELQKQIAENNANAEQAKRILEVLNDPQALDTLTQNITNGELDLATSTQIVDAIRANDFDALLDANPETRIDPNDSAETKAAKEKKREYLKNMGKGSGILLLILMSMITELAPEFTK